MASRKPKPISINPRATHKPEDADDSQHYSEPEYGAEPQLPLEQTLEEALAEDRSGPSGPPFLIPQLPRAAQELIDQEIASASAPTRIKLKWTDTMKRVAAGAINDYLQSAGAMPSILDLYEILKDDEAFIHTAGKLNHKNVPLFSSQSLQAGINALRKQTAKDIADDLASNGSTDLIPLPSLARVQVERKKRVTDTRALSQFIANLPALRATREMESGSGEVLGSSEG